MNRLEEFFKEQRRKRKKALIAFITAGDPSLAMTGKYIRALECAGADIVELGIPFSDPMADGPTIQLSSERALRAHTTLDGVLTLVSKAREKTSVPIVLFGYYNPIFAYGLRRFSLKAREAGCDGVLVVDLPPEESGELKRELDKAGLPLIRLLAPTGDMERMRLVGRDAAGFIYYVSVTGVTGARAKLPAGVEASIKNIRKASGLPVAVGFGISTPSQARRVAQVSDAVVVGSAIVNITAKGGAGSVKEVERFVRSLKRAISS